MPEAPPRTPMRRTGQFPRAAGSATRQAMRNSILAQSFGTVFQSMLLQGGVLALLLLSLGGDEFEVGLVFTLHNVALIARLFSAPKLDVGRLKWIVYRWQLISVAAAALVLIAYPLVAQWDARLGRWAIVGLLGAYFICRQMGQAAWPPLMSQVIPPSLRGRFFGRMRTILRVVAFAAILLAGLILGQNPSLGQFLPILGMGVGAYGMRLYFLYRLPDPDAPRAGEPEPLLRVLGRPLKDPPFRRFVSFAFVTRMLPMLTLPFMVPFLVRELGVPSGYSVYASAFVMVGGILTLSAWGRMVDRRGSTLTYAMSLIALGASAAVYAAAPAYETAALVTLALAALGFAFYGIGVAGIGIAETVRMMHQTPDAYRGSYMTLVATGHGVAGAAASFVGGGLLASLPVEVELLALDQALYTKRLYFIAAAVLAAGVVPMLMWLLAIGRNRSRRRLAPVLKLKTAWRAVRPRAAGRREAPHGDTDAEDPTRL